MHHIRNPDIRKCLVWTVLQPICNIAPDVQNDRTGYPEMSGFGCASIYVLLHRLLKTRNKREEILDCRIKAVKSTDPDIRKCLVWAVVPAPRLMNGDMITLVTLPILVTPAKLFVFPKTIHLINKIIKETNDTK